MIKWIFFDIDNTLYETNQLAEEARKNAVNAMISAGLPVNSVSETYKKLKKIIEQYSSNYEEHFDRLVEEFNVEKEKYNIIAAGVVAYHNTKFELLKPSIEMVDTLRELKKKYKLGIISNGRSVKQREKLIRLGIQNFFNIIIISEEAGFEKPNSEIFKKAIEEAGCNAEEAVMVGDREEDMSAKNIGMKTINIKNIDNFEELKEEVDELG